MISKIVSLFDIDIEKRERKREIRRRKYKLIEKRR